MRVLIAGGGTGGHLFPGIALAEEVTTRHHENEVLFVGTAPRARGAGGARRGLPAGDDRGAAGSRAWASGSCSRRCSRCRWRFVESLADPPPLPARRGGGRGRLRLGPGGAGGLAAGRAHRGPGAERAAGAHQPHPGQAACGRSSSPSTRRGASSRRRKMHLVGNPIRRKLMDNYLRSPAGARRSFTPAGLRRLAGRAGAQHPGAGGAAPTWTTLQDRLHGASTRPARPTWSAVRAGLRGRGASRPRWWSSSTTCPPPTPRPSWCVCRAGATTLAELTVCKKAVDPRARSRSPPTITRRSTPRRWSTAGAARDVPRGGADRRGAGRASSARSPTTPSGCRQMEQAAGAAGAPRGGAGAGRRLRPS